MTNREIHKFRAILETRQAEVTAALRNREEIAIEKRADELDRVQLATERELAVTHLHREATLLRNVRAALRRLEQGIFGICLHCEAEISRRRLEAVPWTPLCIRCQEAVDRGEKEAIETVEWLLPNAA